jgi:hypothetical protein
MMVDAVPYSPKNSKMKIIPGDDISTAMVETLLGESVSSGLLDLYEVDGRRQTVFAGCRLGPGSKGSPPDVPVSRTSAGA